MDKPADLLLRAGFDTEKGRVLLAVPALNEDETDFDFYHSPENWQLVEVQLSHSTLQTPVNTGYGWVEMPPLFAEDEHFVYIVGVYDGSSWIERIPKGIDVLLEKTRKIPFVGGG